jgi:hypothetical protein
LLILRTCSRARWGRVFFGFSTVSTQFIDLLLGVSF